MQDSDMPDTGGAQDGGNAKIVYILYLAAVIIGPLALIGVVIAHVARNDSGGWVNDHYRFQIRTFWICLVYLAVGVVTTSIVIGWLVMLAALRRAATGLGNLLLNTECDFPLVARR